MKSINVSYNNVTSASLHMNANGGFNSYLSIMFANGSHLMIWLNPPKKTAAEAAVDISSDTQTD